ncbi:hypothetical protein EW146_g10309 [Bondarzewia mesenterica]|uniref:Uncharacterized protein n=1 Tax=Bondarzewia mesenterica TaxID=1095465 RepID=A0A4S4KYG7_9AGAM|nr:hypothetical protein EW146_g10309 [Bondarzewia mesenterica]
MSSAHLCGIGVYENVRSICDNAGNRNDRLLAMDVHIYVPGYPDALALLRYYNHANKKFVDDEPAAFFFYANIITPLPSPDGKITIPSAGNDDLAGDASQYMLVGDLRWVSLISDITAIDVEEKPWLNVCGPVTMASTMTSTFEMQPKQFTQAFRDKGTFPVLASIPDSKKYKNAKKPIPSVSAIVEADGLMEAFDETTRQMQLTVDSVTFLASAPLNVPKTPMTNTTGKGKIASSKFKFNYGSKTGTPRASQGSTTLLPPPSTQPPSTPTPGPSKTRSSETVDPLIMGKLKRRRVESDDDGPEKDGNDTELEDGELEYEQA